MIDKLSELFPFLEQYPLALSLLKVTIVVTCISVSISLIKYCFIYPFRYCIYPFKRVSRETKSVKKVWNYEENI